GHCVEPHLAPARHRCRNNRGSTAGTGGSVWTGRRLPGRRTGVRSSVGPLSTVLDGLTTGVPQRSVLLRNGAGPSAVCTIHAGLRCRGHRAALPTAPAPAWA